MEKDERIKIFSGQHLKSKLQGTKECKRWKRLNGLWGCLEGRLFCVKA